MAERKVALPNINVDQLGRQINLIRWQRVMLDSDLARLYGVSVSALNQAVTKNTGRFPTDFAYRLTLPEFRT